MSVQRSATDLPGWNTDSEAIHSKNPRGRPVYAGEKTFVDAAFE